MLLSRKLNYGANTYRTGAGLRSRKPDLGQHIIKSGQTELGIHRYDKQQEVETMVTGRIGRKRVKATYHLGDGKASEARGVAAAARVRARLEKEAKKHEREVI
jgi:hypothetical protein